MSVFYFHYNKPASKKFGKPQLSIHYKKTCYIVDYIKCEVPTYSHNRNKQPHCVIKGRCTEINIKNGFAIIW